LRLTLHQQRDYKQHRDEQKRDWRKMRVPPRKWKRKHCHVPEWIAEAEKNTGTVTDHRAGI
jgi:hypothetical protein